MHASISATRAFDDRQVVTCVRKQRTERFLDDLLNREPVRLTLPTGVCRAVVRERELEAPHYPFRSVREPGLVIGTPDAHSGHASG
jgi:hypothetical protein